MARWIYPSVVRPPRAPVPPVMSTWFAGVNQPYRVRQPLLLEGSRVVDAKQLTQPERTTPDKWYQETAKPLFRLPVLVPEGNFAIDATSPKVPIDRWHRPIENPRWGLPQNQFLYPALTIDTLQLTQAERSTVDKWWQETARPIWQKQRNEFVYPPFTIDPFQLTQAERATVDKWLFRDRNPIWPVPPTMATWKHIYGAAALETPTLDRWLFKQPEFIQRRENRAFTYPASLSDPGALLQEEIVTLDKWHRWIENPIWTARRMTLFDSLPKDTGTPSETVTLDKWEFHPAQINRVVPGLLLDLIWSDLTTYNQITLDRWVQPQAQPLFRAKPPSQAWEPGAFNPFPLTVAPSGWLPYRTDPQFRIPTLLHCLWTSIDPTALTLKEILTINKWFSPPPGPRFDIRRWQYLYPSFMIDAKFDFAASSGVSGDGKLYLGGGPELGILPPGLGGW